MVTETNATPSASNSPSLHPAVTVSNIRNYIPITLDAETGQYTSWVELFKIHCRAFDVIDHIIPPEPKDTSTSAPPSPLWPRLDAIVLQWIYGTISKDLLTTILSPNTTAATAWKSLEHIFIDSKPSRAIHLKQKFANLKLENFSTMNAYCQEVKSVSDQLANVDAPVDNQSLVLQLISGLSEQYDSIATLLQQSTPLPDFYTTRSKLCMEESRKANQTTNTALHTSTHKPPSPDTNSGGTPASPRLPSSTTRIPLGLATLLAGAAAGVAVVVVAALVDADFTPHILLGQPHVQTTTLHHTHGTVPLARIPPLLSPHHPPAPRVF